MATIEKVLDLDGMRAEIADLGVQVAAPDLWDDQANAQRVTGRLSVLQSEIERVTGLRPRLEGVQIMIQRGTEGGDPATLPLQDQELEVLPAVIVPLEVRTLPAGEYDE